MSSIRGSVTVYRRLRANKICLGNKLYRVFPYYLVLGGNRALVIQARVGNVCHAVSSRLFTGSRTTRIR